MKGWHAVAVYLAAGVGVAAWTAARADAGKPTYQGLPFGPRSALLGVASCVVLWPYAAVVNLTAHQD